MVWIAVELLLPRPTSPRLSLVGVLVSSLMWWPGTTSQCSSLILLWMCFFVWALVSADFVCLGVLGVALFVHTCHVYCFITSINWLIDWYIHTSTHAFSHLYQSHNQLNQSFVVVFVMTSPSGIAYIGGTKMSQRWGIPPDSESKEIRLSLVVVDSHFIDWGTTQGRLSMPTADVLSTIVKRSMLTDVDCRQTVKL